MRAKFDWDVCILEETIFRASVPSNVAILGMRGFCCEKIRHNVYQFFFQTENNWKYVLEKELWCFDDVLLVMNLWCLALIMYVGNPLWCEFYVSVRVPL